MRILPSVLAFAVVSFAMSLSPAQDSSPPASVTATGGPLPAAVAASSPTAVALGDPIDRVSPKYPKLAMKQNLQGAVVLSLSVAKNGRVESVAVVSGDPVLADAATHAVRKWRYDPYLRNGQPVEVRTTITINFKLTDKGEPVISAKYNLPSEPGDQVAKQEPHVSAPRALYTPDPEYSEDAREARVNGTVVLSIVVGTDGKPHDIEVTRSLGHGLDEKAIEAVQGWRFEPATKDGQPVAALIRVKVQYRFGR